MISVGCLVDFWKSTSFDFDLLKVTPLKTKMTDGNKNNHLIQCISYFFRMLIFQLSSALHLSLLKKFDIFA